jgi:hypothetical protein
MLITVDDLRRHGLEKHSVACTKELLTSCGIDFKDFVKNGADHTVVLPVAKDREDVREFLDFMGLGY